MGNNILRAISSKVEGNKIKILTEFGYIIEGEVQVDVQIDPITEYDDGFPDFTMTASIVNPVTTKQTDAKSLKEVQALLQQRSITPPNLQYDYVLVGFVYGNPNDPNNHRWWLDFRKGNQPVFHYYCDKLTINAPFNTFSWPDAGFSHGRFKVGQVDINSIKEPELNHVVIEGSGAETGVEPGAKDYIGSFYRYLRVRYNTRADLWYVDVLGVNDKVERVIETGSVICDAKPVIGNRVDLEGKPRISALISKDHIAGTYRMGNTIIIKGK